MVRLLFIKESRLCISCLGREVGVCVCGKGREESAFVVSEMYCSSLGLEAGGGSN